MIRPLAAFALALAFSGSALADARTDLHAAFVKFLAQSSFEVHDQSTRDDVTLESTVEFQAPDRYRVTLPGKPPVIVVGDAVYMPSNGSYMKVPASPGGLVGQYRNPDTVAKVDGATVQDLGPDPVDGVAARHYRYFVAGSGTDVWVGDANGLPIQLTYELVRGGKTVYTRARYGRYGDPGIRIEAP
jgi:hypothetical protein